MMQEKPDPLESLLREQTKQTLIEMIISMRHQMQAACMRECITREQLANALSEKTRDVIASKIALYNSINTMIEEKRRLAIWPRYSIEQMRSSADELWREIIKLAGPHSKRLINGMLEGARINTLK